jgi:hypothetical protein
LELGTNENGSVPPGHLVYVNEDRLAVDSQPDNGVVIVVLEGCVLDVHTEIIPDLWSGVKMPVEMTIKLLGAEEYSRALRARPGIVHRHFIKATKKSVMELNKRANKYPPASPTSTYIRTGTLGKRWTTLVNAQLGNVRGQVRNFTPYGPYVMGTEDQAWMHQGRWKTEIMILEEAEERIIGFFEHELKMIVRDLERRTR